MITIQFLGAAGTVTGSKFAMRVDGHTTLVDCGLFQGLREVRQRNWDSLPIDAGSIGEVVLTHAHVDHSGYLPRSRRDGYHGDVMATHATKDLLRILLPDSGHLQEEEARYRNEVGATKYRPALPLYTAADGADAASHVTGDWEQRVPLGERAMATFHRAGHILGAASVHLDIRGAAGIRRPPLREGPGRRCSTGDLSPQRRGWATPRNALDLHRSRMASALLRRIGMRAIASGPIVEDVHGNDDSLSIELIRRGLSTQQVGFELHLFTEVPSTNDVACGLAEKGAREGTVVLAERQRAGRGRFGHPWFSPEKANLYASVIFRPAIAPSAVPVFSMIASLALADAVTGEGVPASVRWPNDVIVSGRRVGGTLTVVAAAGAVVQHVIFGIGVNLNISSEALAAALGPSAAMATSVSEVAGRPIDRNRFAASLLNRLERWRGLYTGYGPDAVRAAWNQRDALRGRFVEVSGGDTLEAGRVVGVDGSGQLILESDSGDTLVACGEVTTIDGTRIR